MTKHWSFSVLDCFYWRVRVSLLLAKGSRASRRHLHQTAPLEPQYDLMARKLQPRLGRLSGFLQKSGNAGCIYYSKVVILSLAYDAEVRANFGHGASVLRAVCLALSTRKGFVRHAVFLMSWSDYPVA